VPNSALRARSTTPNGAPASCPPARSVGTRASRRSLTRTPPVYSCSSTSPPLALLLVSAPPRLRHCPAQHDQAHQSTATPCLPNNAPRSCPTAPSARAQRRARLVPNGALRSCPTARCASATMARYVGASRRAPAFDVLHSCPSMCSVRARFVGAPRRAPYLPICAFHTVPKRHASFAPNGATRRIPLVLNGMLRQRLSASCARTRRRAPPGALWLYPTPYTPASHGTIHPCAPPDGAPSALNGAPPAAVRKLQQRLWSVLHDTLCTCSTAMTWLRSACTDHDARVQCIVYHESIAHCKHLSVIACVMTREAASGCGCTMYRVHVYDNTYRVSTQSTARPPKICLQNPCRDVSKTYGIWQTSNDFHAIRPFDVRATSG
jgi:hypothetical protein